MASDDMVNAAIELLGNITPTPKFQASIANCDPELMSSEACLKLQKYLLQYRIKLQLKCILIRFFRKIQHLLLKWNV